MYTINANELTTTVSIFRDVHLLQPPRDVSHGIAIVCDSWAEIISAKKRARNGARVLAVVKTNASSISAFFSYAWSSRFKDILIVQAERNGKVYAFNPFFNLTQRFDFDQVKEIKRFLISKSYQGVVINGTLFDNSPIAVNVGDFFIGVDSMLIQTISEQLNVRIETHEPYDGEQFGYRSENGSLTGAVMELYTKGADIAFNQVFVKDYGAPDLIFTNIIADDCVCVMVPKAKLVPKWTAMFYAFTKEVWALIFFIVATITVGLYIIRKYSVDRTETFQRAYDHTWNTVCLDVFQALTNVTNGNVFSNRYHHRLVLLTIFLYGVTINSLFQSTLVTTSTSEKRYPEIDTLEQLAQSNYLISTHSRSLADVFNNTGNSSMDKLNKRFVVLGNESQYSAFISRRLKHGVLTDLKQKGTEGLHIVHECVTSFALAYLVHRDAYFLDDFNIIINQVVQAGLIHTWRATHKLNLSDLLAENKYVEAEDMGFPRPFTVADVQTSFYILIVGLTIGYIIFLSEFYSGRCYYIP
ncbi:uncharacterized protein LOC116175560 [Photinus pyralis]|uniref:uncharacterized protein LOC116175560 n=1 Tax=Photinus pyralis TaxID=7054 RepID=UPI0012673A42|nr:uncharacterized protein LOC116175560 [Photinus pyralis]